MSYVKEKSEQEECYTKNNPRSSEVYDGWSNLSLQNIYSFNSLSISFCLHNAFFTSALLSHFQEQHQTRCA
jgi:hypothetical protein